MRTTRVDEDVETIVPTCEPKFTLVMPLRFVPVIVTVVPPDTDPVFGLTEVIVGTAERFIGLPGQAGEKSPEGVIEFAANAAASIEAALYRLPNKHPESTEYCHHVPLSIPEK